MNKLLGLSGIVAVGLSVVLAAPAYAATASTITVPDDFVPALSDTRVNGHYEVIGTGLHVWTESNTSTDKVAEYVTTSTPLAMAGEPSLEYTTAGGTIPPGAQLHIDVDGDGTSDGILVGEPSKYGNDWWLSTGAKQSVKDKAPITGGGSGSPWHGTLAQWREALPGANVVAFGFSLGSGVYGDYVLNAINFAGTRYTFKEAVVLIGKDQCKSGGWATSTKPVFKNQGACVSSFASAK